MSVGGSVPVLANSDIAAPDRDDHKEFKVSYYENVGLPEPPPMYVPNPEYAASAALQERLLALLEATDTAGFNELVNRDPEAAVTAMAASELMANPLYWDFHDAWFEYQKLAVGWHFEAARDYYLSHLHPHVGEALGWVDPFTLGEGRRRVALTVDERRRLYNAFMGKLLSRAVDNLEDEDGGDAETSIE